CSSLNPTTTSTWTSRPNAPRTLPSCWARIVRPSLSSVSGFGNGRPRRVPIPAARMTTWGALLTVCPFVSRSGSPTSGAPHRLYRPARRRPRTRLELARVVRQQHGDAVAHRVGQRAVGVGRVQLGLARRAGAVHGARTGHGAPRRLAHPGVDLQAHAGSSSSCARTSDRTSSRTFSMMSSSAASTLSRSSGSVFDARRLNHHWGWESQCETVRPSSSSTSTGPAPCWVTYASTTRARAAGTSATVELISPDATYGSYISASADSGCGCDP